MRRWSKQTYADEKIITMNRSTTGTRTDHTQPQQSINVGARQVWYSIVFHTILIDIGYACYGACIDQHHLYGGVAIGE